jgi:DNA-binding response OmpR family regulator
MAAIPTVLVVDDDAGIRDTMARLLRAYGYCAVTAGSLDEARGLLGSTAIDALILDVGLQAGDNGLDLLTVVRARPEFAKAPILIFTGGVLSDAEHAMVRRHRAFLFHKPEGFDTLIKFLDNLTGRDRPH